METKQPEGESANAPCLRCTELEHKIRHLRQDVAQRVRAVRRMGQVTSIAEEVFQSMPLGLIVCQYQPPGELFCLSANREAERLTGVQAARCRGSEFDESRPDARRLGLTEALLRTVQTGEPICHRQIFYRKGSIERAFLLSAVQLAENRVCVQFQETENGQTTIQELSDNQEHSRDDGDDHTAVLQSRIRDLEREVTRLKFPEQ